MGNSDALTEILASKEASGKKARGETGNTVEERIADFRAQIAERKAKEGKDYLSFYYVTATAYQIED